MAKYLLANDVNLSGAVLRAGKVISDTVYNVNAVQAAGGQLISLPNMLAEQRAVFYEVAARRGQARQFENGSPVPLAAILALESSGPAGPITITGEYGCNISVAVLDAVYIDSPDHVAIADATSSAKVPIGFVLSKSSPTTCEVIYMGELAGFVGLVPNTTYFLSTVPGAIIPQPGPTATGEVVQVMGWSRSTTVLVVEVDPDYTLL